MFVFRNLSDEMLDAQVKHRRDHFANERTFLAWIRTALGIMAFGFVVEKFCVQFSLGNNGRSGCGYVSMISLVLVVLGACVALLATFRYIKFNREIIEGTFRPSIAADLLVATLLLIIAGFLLAYMLNILLP